MRKLVALLVVALTASIAVAFSLWKQLQSERELTARLRAPIASGPARTDPAVSASPHPIQPDPRTPRRNGTTESAPRELPHGEPGAGTDWQAQQRQLLNDPRYLEAMREQRRLTYRLRRDNAMRLFGFSRETADAIVDLDVDEEIRMLSVTPTDKTDEIRLIYEESKRDHDAKLLALLGQDRFDQWQTYMETRGIRMQVDRFRAQLSGADVLRDDQVEPLITAMAAEETQMRSALDQYRESLNWDGDTSDSATKLREKQAEITKAASRRMLASAASILTASQARRLEEMLNTDLQQRAMQDRIESLRQQIGPAPASDTGAE